LAQLRQDHDKFTRRDTAVVVAGPEDAEAFSDYFGKNDLPFTGLPDPDHRVLKLYWQQVKLFKFGRLPAQVLVDKEGIARFVHYGNSMSDIPGNETLLVLIDELEREKPAGSTRAG
jgi:peroxiredoxin